MSCGERVSSDEFDPIPVLISKNTNQGKIKRLPRWALALLKQIQLSQLFLVTTVAWRLDFLKLFYQSNLPKKPCCCFADALLLLQGCSTKMISAYIVFPHTCLCSVKKFHLSLWSFCNFTPSFAPPSALPCPSLSFFFPSAFPLWHIPGGHSHRNSDTSESNIPNLARSLLLVDQLIDL